MCHSKGQIYPRRTSSTQLSGEKKKKTVNEILQQLINPFTAQVWGKLNK